MVPVNDTLRWRCQLTAEFLDRAEPELGAALAAWNDQVREAARARLPIPERALRIAGMATAAFGILAAWAEIVFAPECDARRTALISYGAIPVFVVGGTVFGFWPGVAAEIRSKVRRSAWRRGRRLIAPLRRRAPCDAEYLLSGSRLEVRVQPSNLHHATDFASIRAAVAGAHLACFFGRRWPGMLHRVVWFPDPQARLAVCDALRAAGVAVTELPAPALVS